MASTSMLQRRCERRLKNSLMTLKNTFLLVDNGRRRAGRLNRERFSALRVMF